MSQTLEQLVLRLDAQTAEYRAELEKAQKSLETLGEKVDKIGEKVQNAFQKEIVEKALSGVEALAHLAEQGGELAEQMERLAQVTGISTEQIAQLEFAAKATGTSGDSLATSFAKLEKTMAAAAAGNTEAKAAFRALGIEFESSPGRLRPVNAVLEDLANKMKGYQDGAAKTAAAQLLMGRGAAEIVPYLNRLGQEGFKGLEAEASRFGATLSGSTIRDAAELKETLAKLEGGVSTLSVRLAADLGPALERLTTRLTEAGHAGSTFQTIADAAGGVVKVLASAVILGLAPIQEFGRELGVLFATSAALARGQGKEAAEIFSHFAATDDRSQIKSAIDQVKELWSTIKSAPRPGDVDFVGPLQNAVAPIVHDGKKAEEAIKHLGHEIDTLHAKIAELRAGTEGASLNLEVFTSKDLGEKAFEELTQKTQQADAAYAQLSNRIHSGDISKSLEKSGQAAFGLADKLKGAAAQLNALEKLKLVADEGKKAQGELGAELEGLQQKFRNLGKETEQQRIDYELAYGKLHTYVNEIRLAGGSAEALVEKLKAQAVALDNVNAFRDRANTRWERYKSLAQEAKGIIDSQQSTFAKLSLRINELNQMLQYGMLTQKQYNIEIAKMAGQFLGVAELGKQTAQALSDSFAEFILNINEGLSGLVSNFGKVMEQILAKWIATKIIMGTLDAVFGAVLGGTEVGAFLGFAGGGDPEPGKPAIVGENGPEIFVPREHGTIIPNDFASHMSALSAAPSGGDGGQTINASLSFQSLHPSTVTDTQRWLQRDFIPAFRQMIRTGQVDRDLRRLNR